VAAPIDPLERVFEVDSLPGASLPAELARLYDGDLGLSDTCLYANFVATLDGIVSIPTLRNSNTFIAGHNDADRFVMGLLRAYADAVLIGSGVLRASPRGTWLADAIYPPAAGEYASLREALGLPAAPEIAVLTGRGSIDPEHPLLASGALVLTSTAGAARLSAAVPETTAVLALADAETIDLRLVVDALHGRGHRRILSEAGPHTFGGLLEAGLVDELFLTSSPLLVGDAGPGSRYSLVEGADLVPAATRARLLSMRRHGSHVFTRYALERG
jgi:riboflavin biosynthesis pyrimidine reductase